MQRNGSNFPDFLIVGAMKAGTTTLHHDLAANPGIFMPHLKEVAQLCRSDEELRGEGLAQYAAFFAPAKPGQIIGEASTQYTKFPFYTCIPARARRILGPDVRLIYIVRDPVERIISHHYHDICSPKLSPSVDINTEVRDHPHYLNWTRYAMQIEQWLEFFDVSQVMIMRFEDFVSDRHSWVSRVSEFLGVEPRPDLIDDEAVYNRGDGRAVVRSSFWRSVRMNPVYRTIVHPFISARVRERLRNLVLPPGPPRPDPPSPQTVAYILDELADDMERLRRIMGLSQPVWDLDRTRAKYACARPVACEASC